MTRTGVSLCSLLAAAFMAATVTYASSVDPWESGDLDLDATELMGRVKDPRAKLDSLRLKLVEGYGRYSAHGSLEESDLYEKAIARIDTALKRLAQDPSGRDAARAFQAAWYMTKAAYVQMALTESRALERRLEIDVAEVSRRLDTARVAAEAYSARQQATAPSGEYGSLQNENVTVSATADGVRISLSDVLFEVGKATLAPALKTDLNELARMLAGRSEVRVVVQGHTDNTGREQANLQLSRDRAGNVKNYLVKQGVAAARISAAGLGSQKPVASNDTDEGRRMNRRVDVLIKTGK